jgi:ApaG protein
MYQAVTEYIRITVVPAFLENQSEPDNQKFVWAYTIGVENLGGETVTLLTRHWIITDGLGRRQDVRGDPLNTPSGMMVGSYGMITSLGRQFDVVIPAFSLDSPHDKHSLN